jgi:hypothetical protein
MRESLNSGTLNGSFNTSNHARQVSRYTGGNAYGLLKVMQYFQKRLVKRTSNLYQQPSLRSVVLKG